MSVAYITNASLNQISKSLRTKKTRISRGQMIDDVSSDFGVEDIITADILNDIFNSNELKDIYFMKMVLKDFAMLLDEIQGNKQIITEFVNNSNRMYALEVKAPSYHKDTACQWMNKSFHNIQVPSECLKDKEMEKKAKDWINENRNMKFELLNEQFKVLFNCKEGLTQIDRKNSGTTSFENSQIDIEFNSQVKKQYRQLRLFLDGDLAEKLKNYKYAPSFQIKNILKNDKDTDSHETIIDFHTVKETLKNIIYNFYKSKYNQELKFESTLLDEIGFNTCRGCVTSKI